MRRHRVAGLHMKRCAAALLAAAIAFVTLGGCSTSCNGGTDRGLFCGTGTRF
ncbi:hypothetical protein RSP673_012820 [Ralstonia solanacearum P673]|nr:hypothetical protein [Ralstonia solanacearum]ALF87617.1 hypothetical protein RSUY_12500 [Ralstonia solanacearum]MCL9831966.1 hypothetical protein [Ralstonia solanacearum]MCL9836747.1 hypothetical protein [Ralstonia solanacearum]MCL9841119.1 hypothetical protein [Ralstonia solanacearum]QJC25921.1 hypothetical protein G8D25_17910 [Ralstonia solanacearum]